MGGSMRVTSAAIAALAIMGLGGCTQGLPSSSVLGQSSGSNELFNGIGSDGGGSQRSGPPTATAPQRPGPMQAEIYDGGGVVVASTASRSDGGANASRDDQ